MKKSSSQSLLILLAVVLSVINVGLLIVGIQWAHDFFSRLSTSTDNEAVLSAAEDIDRTHATLVSGIQIVAWGTGLVLGAVLLVLVARNWKQAERAERHAKVQSYTRNLARAKRRGRRRSRSTASASAESAMT